MNLSILCYFMVMFLFLLLEAGSPGGGVARYQRTDTRILLTVRCRSLHFTSLLILPQDEILSRISSCATVPPGLSTSILPACLVAFLLNQISEWVHV